MSSPGVEPDEPPSECVHCGTPAEDPASVLTWTLNVHDDGWDWICPPCSREHLPEIEARLGLDDW